jgi:hypothetical protein
MESPNFLKKKYDLHNAPEVESAANRTEKRTHEKIPQNPTNHIQNYLDRFNEILDRENPEKRERGIEALKRVLNDKFVIKPEEIPENYFENQRRIAREQGHGDTEITNEMREQLTEVIITDQKSSLDNWIDYLSSKDAAYPDWLKYYAVRSILGLGEYDKEKKQFTKRSKGTTKPFPDLNREALAYVLDAIEKKYQGKIQEQDAEFQKYLQGENFAKLYAWAIDKVTPESADKLVNTKGEWKKYDQNSDHMPLVESLQGHGTGWCTAGESTAQAQLKDGDFYVYYSYDENGNPTIPRVAIRMNSNQIAEVRGIAPEQNLDPYIGDVVKEKLKEFPDGAAYEKKSADMKLLTEIEKKTKAGQELNKDDLVFLYEINSPIEGFGYQRDPRIKEIRETRIAEKDVPIVFEYAPEEVAHSFSEISENTKAYIGKLEPGIFEALPPSVEHLYTKFPEERIKFRNVELGTGIKDGEEFQKAIEEREMKIYKWAEDVLKNPDFKVVGERRNADLVEVSVRSLGFEKWTKYEDICKRAIELGLELCPAEVGPQLRLQYTDQPLGEYLIIAMKAIDDSDGDPGLFDVDRRDDGLWLDTHGGRSDGGWGPGNRFVFFRPRK